MNLPQYRDIEGFPGYRICDDGSVWGCRLPDGSLGDIWKLMALYRRTYGARYMVLGLRAEPCGKLRILYVHRLVLEAFVGPCPQGMECLHDDGNTSNNRLSNLCWGTRIENAKDRDRHGTQRRGSSCRNAKLNEQAVLEMRRLEQTGVTHANLARLYDVSQPYVSAVCRGKRWKHVPMQS
jgi:hypothetical protein